MKRITALLLCLLFLFLTACGGTGDTNTDTGTDAPAPAVAVPLFENQDTDYVIIYPKGATDLLKNAVIELKNYIMNITGKQPVVRTDDVATHGEVAKEILIGNTSREASGQVLEAMNIAGYRVAWVGEKLVVSMTNAAMAVEAIDALTEAWTEAFYNECNFDGKLFFALGDIAHSMYSSLEVVFVNETLYQSRDVGEMGDVDALYQLVRDGRWTYEVFKEYATNFGSDGLSAEEQDYGAIINFGSVRAMVPALEMGFTYRDNNGRIQLYATPTNKMVDLFEDMQNFIMHSGDVYYTKNSSTAAATQNPVFTSSRGLFYFQTLGEAVNIREMTDVFGVLPFPKYDDLQESYHTGVYNSTSAIMVPYSVSKNDFTMIGTITEALCMYGYQGVTPNYYEQTLTNQVFGSENTQDMLKIIRAGFTVDFCLSNSFAWGGVHPYAVFQGSLTSETNNFVSNWNQRYTALNNTLIDMYGSINAYYH